MNKSLKLILIGLAAIIVIAVSASALIYFLLPIAKIKDFAAGYLSSQLHRQVAVKSVSFNLFTGIKLNGISISNRKGFDDRPFISADSVVLRYALWPLLQGKIVVPELTLVNPQVIIEKSRKGDFNFSDILGPDDNAKPVTLVRKRRGRKQTIVQPPPPAKKPLSDSGQPIDLIVNTFSIKNGSIIYIDYLSGAENRLKSLNVKVSDITLALLRPVSVQVHTVGTYQNHNVPISLSGSVKVDLPNETFSIPDLTLSIAGEKLFSSIKVIKGSDIQISATSDRFTIDPLLAVFAAPTSKIPKDKKVEAGLTQSLKSSMGMIPNDLRIRGNISLKLVSLSRLKLDTAVLGFELKKRNLSFEIKELTAYKGRLFSKGILNLPALSYNIGNFELKGLDSTPLINDTIDSFLPTMFDMKNKVEGKLDASLAVKGSGIEMPHVLNNLSASGIILLSDGMLKKLRSLEGIGEKYNLMLLKHDMLVRGLRAELSFAGKKLDVKRLTVQDTDLTVNFTGVLDFNSGEYVKGNLLTLKFSPTATRDLPREFSLLKDSQGFTSVDFELTGPLSRPLPSPRFEKPIEAVVGNLKVKIEAKQVEIENKAKQEASQLGSKLEQEAQQKATVETEKLKEDAKKKIKEIFSF